MAERPEDLNLPNAVITRIIKEAVSPARARDSLHFPQRKHGAFCGATLISYFLLIFVQLVSTLKIPGWR